MQSIPHTEYPVVLRTDFSDQKASDNIRSEIRKPVGIFRFRANVNFFDRVEYADITREQLFEFLPDTYNHSFIMIVDRDTVSRVDHPLLILDLVEKSGLAFRASPSKVQSIENNLSLANMGFEEFANAVDSEGAFRGVPGE